MKMKTMTTTLRMEKRKKSTKKRQMKMITHRIRKMTQVTTSSKINTKLTKKMPPSKMMAQKN